MTHASLSSGVLSILAKCMIVVLLIFATRLSDAMMLNTRDIIVTQPRSEEVILNGTVSLLCRIKGYDRRDQEVYWIKDEFGIGGTRQDIQNFGRKNSNEPSRFDLPNNLKLGHFDLQINQIRLSDEGSYKCQVTIKDKITQSQSANLTVLVPSMTPRLYQYSNKTGILLGERDTENPVVITDGEIMVLKCLSENGKPGADLIWFLNDLPVSKSSFPNLYLEERKVRSKSLNILFDSWSKIFIPINRMRHGNKITCRANNRGYENYLRPSVESPVEVNYGPDVTISVQPSRPNFLFNDREIVRFHCSAAGRPNKFTWKWTLNGEEIRDVNGPSYQLVMSKEKHNSTIACIAESFREGANSRKVFAKFGPDFLDDSVLLYPTTIGSNERLTCQAVGNPPPRIEWRRENQPHVISTGSYLDRFNVRQADLGTYICTAHIEGFMPKSKKVFLLPKQPPTILPGQLFHGSVGHQVVLKCEVRAVPPLIEDQTIWIHNGAKVSRNSRYAFEQETTNDGIVLVKLIIKNVHVNDFGEYNCTVFNSLGTDTKLIKLIIEDSIPLNFIISLCVVTLIAFTLVILFYFVCKHRKSRKEYEKSQVSKNFDKNPFTSTLLGPPAKSPNLMPACHFISQDGHEYPTNYSEWSYLPDKALSASTNYLDSSFMNHCGLEYEDGISLANSQKYSNHGLLLSRNETPAGTDQIYRITTPSQNVSYTGVLLNTYSPNFDRKSFTNQQVYGYPRNCAEMNPKTNYPYVDPAASIIGSSVQISNYSNNMPRKDFLSHDINSVGEHATNV